MQTVEPSAELENLLQSDEQLEWVVQPRTKARFVTLGVVAAIVGVFLGLFAGGFFGVFIAAALDSGWAFLVVFLVGLVGVPMLLVGLVALLSFKYKMEYAATNNRLITYGGSFGRDLDSVPVEKVQDAEFDVGMVQNFFDVGTATIDTDPGVESMQFSSVDNPSEVATAITKLAQREEPPTAAE